MPALALLAALVACSAPPAGTTDLEPPTGLEAHELDGAVRLQWSAVPGDGGAGYRVFQAGADAGSLLPVDDVAVESALVDGLENHERYHFAVATLDADGQASTPSEPVAASPFSTATTPLVGFEEDGPEGIKYAVLGDGSRYVVHTEEEFTEDEGLEVPRYEPGGAGAAAQSVRSAAARRPVTFTLASYQTPIRNQGPRGTCQTFGAVAAIESAYLRDGEGPLDLSEQWTSHVYRQVKLDPTPGSDAASWENRLGSGNGGSVRGLLDRLRPYRIPLEADAPYQAVRGYGTMNQPGDAPRIDTSDPGVGQRELDDWNLQDQETTYFVPDEIRHTPFPREALWNAQHGVRTFQEASNEDRFDPDWYRDTLLDGHPIVIGFCMRDTSSDDDGVWRSEQPSGANCRGHAVLVIGYDYSDPDDPQFIAKNSWGGSAYQRMERAYFENPRYVMGAYVVTEIDDPSPEPLHPQRALGRWHLVYDGDEALLDINRLSEFYDGRTYLSGGQADRRLGALFDANGDAHRVNGTVDAADLRVDAFVDFQNPALDYETQAGTRFTGYVSEADPTFLAGTFRPAGASSDYGFYADKDGATPSMPGGVRDDAESYRGTWRVLGFGEAAYLVIDAVDASGTFSGTVTTDGGRAVTGSVALSEGRMSVRIPDPDGDEGIFSGYAHASDAGTLSGGFQRGTVPGGLALVRHGPRPHVGIHPLGQLRDGGSLELGATTAAFPSESDVRIHWSFRRTGETEFTSFANSADGQGWETSTLPCDDLVLRAEAIDEHSGLSAVDHEPLSCLPASETRGWHADRARSGWVTDQQEMATVETSSVLLVGDDDFDLAYRGLLHFGWILPDDLERIVSAEVSLRVDRIEGTPAADLFALRATPVDYGDALDANDFAPHALPGATALDFDGTSGPGTLAFDVTDAMRDAWNARGTRGDRLQLLLHFQALTDEDGVKDQIIIDAQDAPGTSLQPYLEVTFEAD